MLILLGLPIMFASNRTTGQSPDGEGEARLDAVARYVEGLSRPDGGYGWADQPDAHLTPTFAAIGSLHLVGRSVSRSRERAEFVRTHHPLLGVSSEVDYSESERRTFTYQQIQSLLWLDADVRSFRERVRGWNDIFAYPSYYELDENPVLEQVVMALICRELLGLPADSLTEEMGRYLAARRRPNGSFNNTPAGDGGDGNVLNTYWGIRALGILQRADPLRDETVAWLRATQLDEGGFTYAPNAEIGGIDDALYTWAAVRALEALGAVPADPEGAVRYLLSLWNPDGGFGDRPGLPSRPMATYYALDALHALGALEALQDHAIDERPAAQEPPTNALPDDLRVFTIQLQAQGNGSPREAVALAHALEIHLWGAKNADPAWIAAAQRIADQENVPVTFFPSNEDYGLYVRLPGVGTYSHLSDPIAPPRSTDFFDQTRLEQDVISWSEFREERVGPLQAAGGRMVSQVFSNRVLTRILLDHSVESDTGYAAISTFHHGQNFPYLWPYLFRYRHTIPFVALQDAHGSEAWWWADDLTGYRTIFLAREPTWEGWLNALKNNWVVAVRHDALIDFRTRMLGGAPGVQDLVERRIEEWKWWGDDPAELRRPWVSVVAVTPADRQEVARLERGVAIRVRCWWRGRRRREQQVVELMALTIDGRPVAPSLVEEKDRDGAIVDRYHLYQLPASTAGPHVVEATVRNVESGVQRTETFHFEFPTSPALEFEIQ